MSAQRFDLINYLIARKGFKSYLEVGTQNVVNCFNKIYLEDKECIDPCPIGCTVTYEMTSDEAFKIIIEKKKKYDIIFIDGLHESGQVNKDIENSLTCLNEGGIIVVHDCNPPTKDHAVSEEEFKKDMKKTNGEWNGDVYKSIMKLRKEREDLKVFVVNTDWGCGIIMKEKSGPFLKYTKIQYNYEYFDEHRNDCLGLIEVDDFLKMF